MGVRGFVEGHQHSHNRQRHPRIVLYSYRVERGNLGYNFTVLPLTSHRSNPRRLRYAVFTKNYRETVLFKIMKELVPLCYDTENAALPNSFVRFPAKNG